MIQHQLFKRLALSCILLIFCNSGHSMIDLKNSNFSDVWTDIILPGSGFELKIERTYNSRTIFSGIFGFGWCSNFETTLAVSMVNTIVLTECGAGQRIDYGVPVPSKHVNAILRKHIKNRNPGRSESQMLGLKEDLITDIALREELARRLKLKGEVIEGKFYRANGTGAEYIYFEDDKYTRVKTNWERGIFDIEGRLIKLHDLHGNFLEFSYEGKKIDKVSDNFGRSLSFFYQAEGPNEGKLKLIEGPDDLKATYEFDDQALTSMTNQWGSHYSYEYDDLHNLTRINFPDDTYKALTYDKERDLVLSFRHRNACLETYTYEINRENEAGHYWSTVEKKCDGKITNQSKYEFIYKFMEDKLSKYLYKVRSKVNDRTSEVIYHEKFGRAIYTNKNGNITRFSYYDDGMLSTKTVEYRSSEYEYNKSCKKLSRIKTDYFEDDDLTAGGKNLVSTELLEFNYSKDKCSLIHAASSDGLSVKVIYDGLGRIRELQDNQNKITKIKYDNIWGKPSNINIQNIGSADIQYDNNADVSDITSKGGPEISNIVNNHYKKLMGLISSNSHH